MKWYIQKCSMRILERQWVPFLKRRDRGCQRDCPSSQSRKNYWRSEGHPRADLWELRPHLCCGLSSEAGLRLQVSCKTWGGKWWNVTTVWAWSETWKYNMTDYPKFSNTSLGHYLPQLHRESRLYFHFNYILYSSKMSSWFLICSCWCKHVLRVYLWPWCNQHLFTWTAVIPAVEQQSHQTHNRVSIFATNPVFIPLLIPIASTLPFFWVLLSLHQWNWTLLVSIGAS